MGFPYGKHGTLPGIPSGRNHLFLNDLEHPELKGIQICTFKRAHIYIYIKHAYVLTIENHLQYVYKTYEPLQKKQPKHFNFYTNYTKLL